MMQQPKPGIHLRRTMKRHLISTALAIVLAALWHTQPDAVGRPGITPVACSQQQWAPDDPAFDPLPGAKAFFGSYDGGIYQIEIPEHWNGELVLSAHGFVSSGGANGSRLRVRPPGIRQHLIWQGFAWAASSYRC